MTGIWGRTRSIKLYKMWVWANTLHEQWVNRTETYRSVTIWWFIHTNLQDEEEGGYSLPDIVPGPVHRVPVFVPSSTKEEKLSSTLPSIPGIETSSSSASSEFGVTVFAEVRSVWPFHRFVIVKRRVSVVGWCNSIRNSGLAPHPHTQQMGTSKADHTTDPDLISATQALRVD